MPHQTTPTPAATPGTFEAAQAAYDAAYEAARAANNGRKPKRRAVLAIALRPFLSKKP
ncbi:hypothetical protein [Hymenobacter sp. YC55]|uniref:hypothetical protein n=1 Tax=Hymenobacter sp. YC55 TaxID=3034019 RepID=UPI0023F96F5E|nr:hypothetical protein [Hymenobacter sp. YC55]MDF7815302.1 hypothetical protein [Hymenobacter sp. YC55]